jgi:hypothetical protein
VAGIAVDQDTPAEKGKKRRAQTTGEIPQEICASGDFSNTLLAHAEGVGKLERGFSQMLIIEEQSTTIFEAVPLEATQKNVDESMVPRQIAGGLQDLKPEHVVSESIEAEKVLQEAAPVPATLWIAGK